MASDTAVRARTARTAHKCEGCHWTSSRRGKATIAPGHRYLLHTQFPNDETNTSERPYAVKECVACATARDPFGDVLGAGACSTFCCGDVPCALPPHPAGDDHSCLRCSVWIYVEQWTDRDGNTWTRTANEKPWSGMGGVSLSDEQLAARGPLTNTSHTVPGTPTGGGGRG